VEVASELDRRQKPHTRLKSIAYMLRIIDNFPDLSKFVNQFESLYGDLELAE